MIEVRNLSWATNSNVIFSNFNLKINKGEKIIFSNLSGSGKTSLLKFIGGFKKFDSGSIYINNLKINKNNIKNIRSYISYISQKVDLEDEKMDLLLKNIFSYEINRHIKNYEEQFLKLSKIFSLEENILQKQTKNLSGGEKQRIAFIICLILDREIWLLDEITASLDYTLKRKVEDYIISSDKTILISSHDKHWNMKNFREVIW